MLRKEESHRGRCCETAQSLAEDIRQHLRDRETPRQPKTKRDRRVQVGTGNIANGVDHRENHQPERQSDANVRDGSIADVIDDNRASASEDERERSEKLRNQFLAQACHVAGSVFDIRWLVEQESAGSNATKI